MEQEEIKAYINDNEIVTESKNTLVKVSFHKPINKCKIRRILLGDKTVKFKRLKDNLSIQVIIPNEYLTSFSLPLSIFFSSFSPLTLSLPSPFPFVYTKTLVEDNHLYIKIMVYNGTFFMNSISDPKELLENIKIEENDKSSVKNLKDKLIFIEELDNSCYLLGFNIQDEKLDKVLGKICFNRLCIRTTKEIVVYTHKECVFYYSDNKKNNNLVSKCPLVSSLGELGVEGTSSNASEEIYDKVMKDKFPWRKVVSCGLSLIGIGAGAIGSYHDRSYGASAAGVVGMLTGLLGNLLGIGEADPLDSIREQLSTISGQLNEISQQLADLTNYLKQISDQIYKGVNRVIYLSYAQNWDKFNSMLEEAIGFENNIVSQIKDYYYQWIKGNKGNTLTFYFADAFDENGKKSSDFGFVNPKYDSEYCTDDVKIQRKFTLEFNIKEIFKETIKACEAGYNNDFMKLFLADIKNVDLNKDIKVKIEMASMTASMTGEDNNENNCYQEYLKSINNNKEIIAMNALTALSIDALKSIFTNDQRGKEKAIDLNNLVINLLKAFGGISTAGGVAPKFSDYYNMLYNKYSFQNEAIAHIKNFRMTMKDIMYHFCALAKSAAEIYPGLDLVSKLKDIYEVCDDIFIKNTGIMEAPNSDAMKKRRDIFGIDYCYITNSFVSMGLLLSYISGTERDDEVGAAVNNLILVKKETGGLAFEQIDARKISMVNTTSLMQIIDRKHLNNIDGSNENFFKKCGVLAGTVSYNLHIKSTGNQLIVTKYDGLDKINLDHYDTNPRAECYWQLYKGSHYFELKGLYYLQSFVHGKKWYKAFRTKGEVYDLNQMNKVRDDLGHVFWHDQRHWQWVTDEVWCFREFKDYQYFYYLFNI